MGEEWSAGAMPEVKNRHIIRHCRNSLDSEALERYELSAVSGERLVYCQYPTVIANRLAQPE